MKKKSVLILGFVGVFALSIGFMKELQSSEVVAQTEQSKVEDGQAFTIEGDVLRVATVEEQEMRENNPIDGDYTTVISAVEQNVVENSTVQSGFVIQENGTGFFFEKVKEN